MATPKRIYKRMYLFTGKGGVGKTTLALAFTKYLLSRGRKIYYMPFEQNFSTPLAKTLKVPILNISTKTAMEFYLEKKLPSKILAQGILKLPFVRTLLSLLPSMGYLAVMGRLLCYLREDKELTIALDAPSTGHILGLFEGFDNFRRIFKKGALFNDIQGMASTLCQEDFLKTVVVCLPLATALQEGRELREKLITYGLRERAVTMAINDSLSVVPELINSSELPKFLRDKLIQEKVALKRVGANRIFPSIPSEDAQEVALILAPYSESLC